MEKLYLNGKLLKDCIKQRAERNNLRPIHIKYQMEKEMNISRQTIHLWLKGLVMPDLNHILALSKYFNVEFEEFIKINKS